VQADAKHGGSANIDRVEVPDLAHIIQIHYAIIHKFR
jgi:hypothetical protein